MNVRSALGGTIRGGGEEPAGAPRLEGVDDGPTDRPAFLAELLRPAAVAERRLEPREEHIEVVEVAELLLEATQGARRRSADRRIDRDREVPQLAEPTDPDAKAVESVRRRPTPGLAVGRDELAVQPSLVVVQEATHAGRGEPPRPAAERRPELLKEAGLALRPQAGPQELAADVRVIAQPTTIPVEPLPFGSGARARLDPLEELDRHVPVPDLAHELGEPADPSVQVLEVRPLGGRDQALPHREAEVEATEVAVQPVEARRARTRVPTDGGGPGRDPVDEPSQLKREADGGRRSCALSRFPHGRSCRVPNRRR